MPEIFEIPSEWLGKMDGKFLDTFIGELKETFGEDVLEKPAVEMLLGSFGWKGSLRKACESCGCMDLYVWYRNLHWWELDRVDDRLLLLVKGRMWTDEEPQTDLFG